jgi:hypothetical protein
LALAPSALSQEQAATDEEEDQGVEHTIAVFLGVSDGEEAEFTFGGEYELRPLELFGFGVVVEHAPGGHDGDGVTVVLGSAFLHPWLGSRLGFGLGSERVSGGDGGEFLVRTSAGYEVKAGSTSITPSLSLDFVDDTEAVVVGVAFGLTF